MSDEGTENGTDNGCRAFARQNHPCPPPSDGWGLAPPLTLLPPPWLQREPDNGHHREADEAGDKYHNGGGNRCITACRDANHSFDLPMERGAISNANAADSAVKLQTNTAVNLPRR